jgi:basic membrane protein A and related proteins
MNTKLYPSFGRIAILVASFIGAFVLLALLLGGLRHTPAQAETTHIGLMLLQGGLGDQGWNDLSYQGVQRAEDELGVIGTLYELFTDTGYLTATQQCAEDGNDLCIGIGFFYIDPVSVTASTYPDTHFAVLDAWIEPAPETWRGISLKDDEAGYLAGTLAGWMTESDVIGGVGGMEIPPVVRFLEGYQHGALCANPAVSVPITYTGSFVDPALGSQAALDMMAQGADVIFGVGGLTGNGAILTATQAGAWGIGVDVDEYYSTFAGGTVEGSERLLTSAMKHLDKAVFFTIQDVISDTFTNGTVTYGVAEDGVGLASFHEAEPAIPQTALNDLARFEFMLRNGKIDIDGPCPGFNAYLPLVAKDAKNLAPIGHLDGNFSAVANAGSYVHVLSYEGLHIVDVSNPRLPTETGSYLDLPDGVQSLFALVNYDFTVWFDYKTWDKGGLYVLDTADPAAPGFANYVDLFDVSYPPLFAYVDDRYAYVVRGAGAGPHHYYGDIQILDVSQPLSITVTGGITTPVRDIFADGDRFYAAWFEVYYGGLSNSGVAIYDVTDPANAQLLGSYLVTNSPYGPYAIGVTAQEDTLYATLSTSQTLVLDFSEPLTPTVAYTLTASAYDNYIYGDELYLYGGDAIYVYDLADPLQPLLNRTYLLSNVADLRADEWHVYAVNESGLYILVR